MQVSLQSYTHSSQGWGYLQGRSVRQMLQSTIAACPHETIIQISLAGMEILDVPFAREAFVLLAREEHGCRGICLTDATNPDILANCDGAATACNMPLTTWTDHHCQILGREPSAGLTPILQYVLTHSVVRANMTTIPLRISVQNASNKLKALWQAGYILRRQMCAESGSLEYEYLRIG